MTTSSSFHVYSLNDLIEHDAESDDCRCGPRLEPLKRSDGSIGWVAVHHSLDGRELTEHA